MLAERRELDKRWMWGRSKGNVYFAQPGIGQPVKIGFTTTLKSRMGELQVCNPHILEVLLTIDGTVDDEGALHKQFHEFWIHGEWFRPEPDIFRWLLRELRNGGPPSFVAPPERLHQAPPKILGYSECQKVALAECIETKAQWLRLRMAGKLPAGAPLDLFRAFKSEGWPGWKAFSHGYPLLRKIRCAANRITFDEGRTVAKSLGIATSIQWEEARKAGKLPKGAPLRPDIAFSKQWQGWGHFLETFTRIGRPPKNFRRPRQRN